MQTAETVYNPTTLPQAAAPAARSNRRRRNYLDNISYASLNPKRCINVVIVVSGVLLVMAGLALVLYGALFYVSVSTASEYERPAVRRRRLDEMYTYLVLVYVGVPVAALGVALWILYLYRTGRCRYCPLCPGAMKRRRLRNNFQQQCLEAGNISNSYARHPTTTLPLDEQDRLVQHAIEEQNGMEDTDSMLVSGGRAVIVRPMQTTI